MISLGVKIVTKWVDKDGEPKLVLQIAKNVVHVVNILLM